MKIPWRELKLVGKNGPVDPREAVLALDFFKKHATLYGTPVSFRKHGLEHEDPANPLTWGPRGELQISWEGFEDEYQKAKEAKRHEKGGGR